VKVYRYACGTTVNIKTAFRQPKRGGRTILDPPGIQQNMKFSEHCWWRL